MIATTDRLVLREFSHGDLDALARILADPLVMYFGPGVRTYAESLGWIERIQAVYRARGFGLWAVTDRADGRLLGTCGLIPQQIEGAEHVEVGYRLARAAWGRGLATEAAQASKNAAFDRFGLDHVISIIEPANRGSIRVAEKNGMRLERTLELWNRPVRIYRLDRAQPSPKR